MTTAHTAATRRAIKNYGKNACVEALRRAEELGEGANTIGFMLNLTTNQADAAINAGRELAKAGAA